MIQDIPIIYNLVQRTLGSVIAHSVYVEDYVRPKANDRILDIGCGPGDILRYLPSKIEYVGFDMNQKYIDAAKRRFGKRGNFLCKKVSRDVIDKTKAFDIVLACGILHHLNDDEALQLFELARSILKPSGRLVSLDGCWIDGQSPLTRYMLLRDRGCYVRTREDYLSLGSIIFLDVKTSIRQDLLRIPYTHLIMECSA